MRTLITAQRPSPVPRCVSKAAIRGASRRPGDRSWRPSRLPRVRARYSGMEAPAARGQCSRTRAEMEQVRTSQTSGAASRPSPEIEVMRGNKGARTHRLTVRTLTINIGICMKRNLNATHLECRTHHLLSPPALRSVDDDDTFDIAMRKSREGGAVECYIL